MLRVLFVFVPNNDNHQAIGLCMEQNIISQGW